MVVFGMLGAADIAPRALVYPCMDDGRARISVMAARDRGRAESFASAHHIPNVVDSYASVVDHSDVTAIYNPLPISHHCEWTIRALEAGKHVLCEKSLACNAKEAKRMADAARAHQCILMDAFHYRYHPMFERAKQIVSSGQLGDLQTIRAEFSVAATPPASDIRMNLETAGGVTMDIGCYPISWVRHLTDLEPDTITAEAETGPPEVDLYLKAEMILPGNIHASIIGDMRNGGGFKAEIEVTGSKGTLRVQNPLVPQMGHYLELEVGDTKQREILDRRPTYSYMLDAFIEAVETGKPPITDGEDGVKQMAVIDRCYQAAGLKPRGT